MKVNGKSKTPITAAQAKKNNGESGGARRSQQTSRKKRSGVKTAVLDRISDGILALDAGMNYTYLNERAGELLGRRAEELIGKNLLEEYSGADRTPFMEACQRALETQSVVWLNEYFTPTDRWLARYIFPGGYVPALSQIAPAVEQARLWITDVEVLRLHYARTLAHWYERVVEARAEIVALYDERFFRMWQFYLAGAMVAFRHDAHLNFQIQLTRRREALPLTRDYMPAAEQAIASDRH